MICTHFLLHSLPLFCPPSFTSFRWAHLPFSTLWFKHLALVPMHALPRTQSPHAILHYVSPSTARRVSDRARSGETTVSRRLTSYTSQIVYEKVRPRLRPILYTSRGQARRALAYLNLQHLDFNGLVRQTHLGEALPWANCTH